MKKIKLMFILLVILICNILTGCSKITSNFEIPFRKFLITDIKSVDELELESIDLNTDNIKLFDIINHKTIINNVFISCSKNYNTSNFYTSIKSYLSDDYYSNLINSATNNSLKETFNSIYEYTYASYKKVNILSLNKTFEDTYYEVEVVSTDNTANFGIQYLEVYIENNKISNIKTISNLTMTTNTKNELSDNSLINKNNIHNEFLSQYKALFDSLTNSNLYNEYNKIVNRNLLLTDTENNSTNLEDSTQINIQIKNLISKTKDKLGLDIDENILKELFISGEGLFNNCGVSNYKISDVNAMAESVYTIQFSSNGKINKFEFTFSRIENKIIKIKQIK